jgi:magnesium chelatase family protein
MPSKIYSCATSGIEAYPVEIEVDLLQGLPRFTVVGLPDAAVQESKERVRSAIVNSGGKFPAVRKVVNLAPADVRKCGPSFDLPIAVGMLLESLQVPDKKTKEAFFMGELALDGSLRPVPGVVSAALLAEQNGFKAIYVPAKNATQALLGANLRVYPVEHLRDLIDHLRGASLLCPAIPGQGELNGAADVSRCIYLRGQEAALQSITVAASGGHNVLFSGSPGCGKTMTARQLKKLLPPLSHKEQIELTQIYSTAGLLHNDQPLITERPFRSVHHTASLISLIGGGMPVRPGEITLAHRGVLFLDELTEFKRPILESLRQPLEDRVITISRAKGAYRFPARFTLIGAMNPCPCGYIGHDKKKCSCTSIEKLKYCKKLSGPFLDRIDIRHKMRPIPIKDLGHDNWFPLETFLGQVEIARAMQQKRFKSSVKLNSDILGREVNKFCVLSRAAESYLHDQLQNETVSARGYTRILKIARTVADMCGDEVIKEPHIFEALQFRLGKV